MAWWKKVIVMAGGPTVNIAIAFFIFWGVFATYGNPRRRARRRAPVIAEVPRLRDARTPSSGRACNADRPAQPGRTRPGSQPGDEIITFNGTPITDWDQLQRPDPRQRRRRGRDRVRRATASS